LAHAPSASAPARTAYREALVQVMLRMEVSLFRQMTSCRAENTGPAAFIAARGYVRSGKKFHEATAKSVIGDLP
ncbi:MAG: hypothetical protein J0H99_17460, partial [Rhodospirillales bacterium]|nr:hypothetical protein [Rhodospirillales bacterium]